MTEDVGNDAHGPSPDESRPPTPRWVKLFGVAGLTVILLVAVLLVAGGEHGPFRHFPPVATPTAQPSPSGTGQVPAGAGGSTTPEMA